MKDDNQDVVGPKLEHLHTPEEIAERAGGISVKSLSELIRKTGLETTTLGHTNPSRKGGRRRRLWGMTPAQASRRSWNSGGAAHTGVNRTELCACTGASPPILDINLMA